MWTFIYKYFDHCYHLHHRHFYYETTGTNLLAEIIQKGQEEICVVK